MEDLTPDVAWVYELQWPDTNEIYIGSTSRTPELRFKVHRKQPHKCYAHLGIQNAKLSRYFSYVPKHNQDRSAEKQHKKEMQARGFVVLDDGDKHNTPLRQSEEAKRNMSAAAKIAQNRPEVKRKQSEIQNRPEAIRKQRLAQGKQFTCTWPDRHVKHYLSLPEAAADLGVGLATIQGYLKGTSTPGMSKRTAHLTGCIFAYL